MTNNSLIIISKSTVKNQPECVRMKVTILTGSEVVKVWHQIICACQAVKNVGASGGKTPCCSEWHSEIRKKSFLCINQFGLAPPTSGTLAHTKQHFNKWKCRSFSIKSSAHGQESRTPTEGPESLSALCAISVLGLPLNALIRYMKKIRDMSYITACTVLSNWLYLNGSTGV